MDKELLIDCLQNKDQIKQYLQQTRKAQNELLSKKSSQVYHVQSAKYGVRQPIQIKNPLLIKSLFATKKLFKERDNSLPICTFKTLPTQSLASFQTDRIHSRCPVYKKFRLKSAFKTLKSQPEEQIRVETAPAMCRSPIIQKSNLPTFFKTLGNTEKKLKKTEATFTYNKNEWGVGGWNIVDDNFDTKIFID